MKIKLKEFVLDYQDKPLEIGTPPEKLTWLEVFTNALNTVVKGEVLTAEKKNEIFQLTMKMYRQSEPNFTAEQLTLIKERVANVYAPIVYGRVCELIDGTAEEPGDPKKPLAN